MPEVTAPPVALPVRRSGEPGELVDAAGKVVCVVDHDRELSDAEADRIAGWIADRLNATGTEGQRVEEKERLS